MHRWLTLPLILVVLLVLGTTGQATLQHRYSFNGDTLDSVGSAHATTNGAGCSFTASTVELPGGSAPADGHVALPAGDIAINTYSGVTFYGWFRFDAVAGAHQKLFSFGAHSASPSWAGNHYILGGIRGGDDGPSNAGISNADDGDGDPWTEESVIGGPTLSASNHLMVVTISDTAISLFVDGESYGSTLLAGESNTNSLDQVAPDVAYLGRSVYADALFGGGIDEFRIYDTAQSTLEVIINGRLGPDDISGNPGAETGRTLVGKDSCVVNGTRQFAYQVSYDIVGDIELSSDPDLVWSSSDTNIATVTSDGVATFLQTGSVDITGTYDSVPLTRTVTVHERDIVHRYNFDGAYAEWDFFDVGFSELDVVGSATAEVFAIRDGAGQVVMDNAFSEYVDFPNGMLSALGAVTFEAWMTMDTSAGGYQRVFDFGACTLGERGPLDLGGFNGTEYLYIARRSTSLECVGEGAADGAFSGWAYGQDVTLDAETHFALTYNPLLGMIDIYQDGVKTGSVAFNGVLDNIDDVNNWIGRSNWGGDSFTDGAVNEFRVYDGVLTPEEISVNYAGGASADPFADPGTLTSVSLSSDITALATGGFGVPTMALGNFSGVSGVPINSWDGVAFSSSDTNVLTVSATGVVTPVGPGTATVEVNLDGITDTLAFEVISVVKPTTLVHRWSFNQTSGTSVPDLVGSADAVVYGTNFTWTGGEVDLSGVGVSSDANSPSGVVSYVELPAGTISGLSSAATFEVFFTWDGPAGTWWERVFDFGSSTGGPGQSGNGVSYMFLTTYAGDGAWYRFALTTNTAGGAESTQLNSGFAGIETVVGSEVHMVITYDAEDSICKMYVNGQQVDSVPAPVALSQLDDPNCWLGRAQWSPDGMYDGRFNEFRIYNGIMTQDEVNRNLAFGADNLPAVDSVSVAGGSATLTWDEHPMELGFGVDASPALLPAGATAWTDTGVTPTVEGTDGLVSNISATVTLGGAEVEHFRLSK